MADNFNLRVFLTENKLTKNAKLLKEEQEDYKYFDEEGIGGFYLGQVKGTTIYSLEDSSVMDTCMYALEGPQGIEFINIDVAGEPISSEELQNEYELQSDIADFIEADITKELRDELDEAFVPKSDAEYKRELEDYLEDNQIYGYTDSLFDILTDPAEETVADKLADFLDDNQIYGYNRGLLAIFRDYSNRNYPDNEDNLDEARYSDSYHTPAAKAVNAKAEQIVRTIRGYSTALQTIQDAIKQVEQEVGSEVTRSERSTLENHLLWMFRREMEMERESVDNKKPIMKETKLTAKERRLVEMVQNAMGITNNDEDQEFDPGHDIEQAQHDIERQFEGEMTPGEYQEKGMPFKDENKLKYNSIEELMKDIEHGTNEAAHKYKMDEMKRVYEALEAKVNSLEEGEHAEHIDQKAVKQMRKDIAALRKAEEKLRKEFDKKFAGKEKKETPVKEKATEALQEGFFDLRKFLAENRK